LRRAHARVAFGGVLLGEVGELAARVQRAAEARRVEAFDRPAKNLSGSMPPPL
jgi:hypothetical protein